MSEALYVAYGDLVVRFVLYKLAHVIGVSDCLPYFHMYLLKYLLPMQL